VDFVNSTCSFVPECRSYRFVFIPRRRDLVDNRRREREAFYKSETIKKLSEMSADGAAMLLREDERLTRRRHGESARLGGLVTVAAGVGLAVFLWGLVPERRVYLLGLIPLLVGFALLACSRWLAPGEWRELPGEVLWYEDDHQTANAGLKTGSVLPWKRM